MTLKLIKLLFIHADEVIPPKVTKDLINNLNNVNVVELDESNHSEVFYNLNTKFYLIYNEIVNVM